MSAAESAPALELRGLRKVFHQGGVELAVLNGIDLALPVGEIVALVGPSGAGKSTMLHVAGLLERPDGGAVLIDVRDCAGLSDEQRTLLRRRALGFVYQFHHLLPEFSALENVMMPQMIAAVPRRQALIRQALYERMPATVRVALHLHAARATLCRIKPARDELDFSDRVLTELR